LLVVDERWQRVIVTAAVWVAVVLVVRFVLRWAFATWERRQAGADEATLASRRTTFSIVTRLIVALVAVIGAWSVLSIFPQTEQIARALLASSAVLALFAGLAFSTPLGNLGSGVLVSFTQPLRLGDRVTVGDHTGFVEAVNLIYTTLVTDEQRRVFVPNTQLTTTPVVNRTIGAARRTVESTIPIPLGTSIPQARALLLDAARDAPDVLDARVVVGDVNDKHVWMQVTAYAPLQADVGAVGSGVRERSLTALAAAGLLPVRS
jgi:small conductance mechanosensitive channel